MATSLAAAHHFSRNLKVCMKYLLLTWPARPISPLYNFIHRHDCMYECRIGLLRLV